MTRMDVIRSQWPTRQKNPGFERLGSCLVGKYGRLSCPTCGCDLFWDAGDAGLRCFACGFPDETLPDVLDGRPALPDYLEHARAQIVACAAKPR
jgi:hypothetical protein